jgi:hypothetical protein
MTPRTPDLLVRSSSAVSDRINVAVRNNEQVICMRRSSSTGMMLADYRIEGNKFYIAGPSNGGIAAFHVAALFPQYFLSVTAFPGYMWEHSLAKLQAISKLCVFMYVDENDEYMWHGEMKKEAEFSRSKGTVARYTVEAGQPHRLDTLAGDHAGRLFDGFAETKKGCSK